MPRTVTHQETTKPDGSPDLKTYFGEEDHLEISQQRSFTEMIYEVLTGEKPTPEKLSIFELILNLTIDHGPDTPSAVEVIKAAKEGKSMTESLAAGIMQIGDRHGGAGEPAMEILYKIQTEKLKVSEFVKQALAEGKKLPGFGHRIYQVDPRTELIFGKLEAAGLGKEYIAIEKELQQELETQKGRKFPINIDGAIAVAFCSFGFEPRLGKAIFFIARTPGLLAHFLNNSTIEDNA